MTDIFPIPMDEAYKIIKKAINYYRGTERTTADFDDLVQNAMIRAVKVIYTYDDKRGAFSKFLFMQASWAIWRQQVHEKGKGRTNFLKATSLDKRRGDDKKLTLLDTLVAEEKIDDDWKLEILIENLKPEEWYLLSEWVLNKKSGRIIAEEMGIKNYIIQSRIRGLRKKVRRIIDENIIR